MGCNRFPQDWIGDLLDGFILWCAENDNEWELGEKISEKAGCVSEEDSGIGRAVAEAVAVSHHKQVKGPSVGMEAIVKVRM